MADRIDQAFRENLVSRLLRDMNLHGMLKGYAAYLLMILDVF